MEGQLNNTIVSGTQTGTEIPMAGQNPLEDKVGNVSNPLLENTDDNVGEETKQAINSLVFLLKTIPKLMLVKKSKLKLIQKMNKIHC